MVVAESAPAAEDQDVIALAVREGRIFLTEDKDFGWLVYAHLQETGGVIFIRFPANVRATLPKAVLDLVDEMGERLTGCFVVVQPGRMRIGRRPEG